MPYIDLTHTFTDGLPVFPGDPSPKLEQIASLAVNGFTDFRLTTSMHAGTHLDAPWHMITGGKKLGDFSVETFFGRGVAVDARDRKLLDVELIDQTKILPGDIVIFCTNWSRKFGSPEYYQAYPVMTAGLAERLAGLGVKMVGVDGPSPDQPPFDVHKVLLSRDILIIENLTNADKLLGCSQCEIFALPMKLLTEGGPSRVVAKVG